MTDSQDQDTDTGLGAVVQDLNLLHMLEAILNTRSITEAGKRLGLSQPAASRAMKKLRAALGDPLLQGKTLTAHAEQLRPPVMRAMAAIQEVFEADSFDPAISSRTFKICSSEYGMGTVLLPFIESLKRNAPRLKFVISYWGPDSISTMKRGDIDMSITSDPETPEGFHARELFQEHYAVLLDRAHPLLAEPDLSTDLVMQRLQELEHVVIHDQDGQHDRMREQMRAWGIPPSHYAITLPTLLGAAAFIIGTERVLVLPESQAKALACGEALALVTIDYHQPMQIKCRAIWSEHMQLDPGLRWLVDQIEIVATQTRKRTL